MKPSNLSYAGAVGRGFAPHADDLTRYFSRGTVFHVGASTGATTLTMVPNATVVHAFEPSLTAFPVLAANIAASPKVVAHNYGLGASTGEFELTFAPGNHSAAYISNLLRASDGHTVERVAIKRMDRAVASLGVKHLDFVRIDVEGFEQKVLLGAKRTLRRMQPVASVAVNHWCLNAFQRTSLPELFATLRGLFPILYAVDGQTYQDLHSADESYLVMHHHIVLGRYPVIIGAFHPHQVAWITSNFRRAPAA